MHTHRRAHTHEYMRIILIQLVWLEHHLASVYEYGFISRSITAFLLHAYRVVVRRYCCCFCLSFFLPKTECAEACIKVKCLDDLAMVYLKWNLEMNAEERDGDTRNRCCCCSITKSFQVSMKSSSFAFYQCLHLTWCSLPFYTNAFAASAPAISV